MSPASFFQPGYFWGLFACALPLAIHFLRRHRILTIDFSTLRFFKTTALRSHHARRLKKVLLLCCRLGIFAVIVVIFSHPFQRNDPFALFGNPNAAIYCWVDPTKSMDYIEKGQPLWRRPMLLLDSLNEKTPSSLEKYWFDETCGKFTLTPTFRGGASNFTRHGPSLCEAMASAFKDEALHSMRPAALVIFSDFQENVGAALDSFFLVNSVNAPIICVSCRPDKSWNFGIRRAVASGDRPIVLTSAVSAIGKDCDNEGISAFLGDMRVGHASIECKGGGQTMTTMEISGSACPAGYVRLDVDDPFQLDNTCYFVLGRGESRRLLVIGDSIRSFPIVAAFKSLGSSRWDPIIRRTPNNVRLDDIDSADCIVCNELPSVPQPMHLLSAKRVFSPKAVLVSPALDSQSFSASVSLLKDKGGTATVKSIRSDKPLCLVLYDTLSALWKGFHALIQKDAVIHQFVEPLPGTVLCEMDNRKPFVTLSMDSCGNSWALFAAPLGASPSNNICETGIYVPILDRVARFALESVHNAAETWIAGKPRRNPFLGSRYPALVYNNRNERHSQWGSQLQVKFDEPGVYRIEPHEGPAFWIAVNPDPQEMDLKYHSPENWKNQKNSITVVNAEGFCMALRTGKGFIFSYGPWMLLVMLLAAEMLLWEKNDVHVKEKTIRKA